MPRKMAGSEMITIEELIVTTRTPSVVLIRATHLYRSAARSARCPSVVILLLRVADASGRPASDGTAYAASSKLSTLVFLISISRKYRPEHPPSGHRQVTHGRAPAMADVTAALITAKETVT